MATTTTIAMATAYDISAFDVSRTIEDTHIIVLNPGVSRCSFAPVHAGYVYITIPIIIIIYKMIENNQI